MSRCARVGADGLGRATSARDFVPWRSGSTDGSLAGGRAPRPPRYWVGVSSVARCEPAALMARPHEQRARSGFDRVADRPGQGLPPPPVSGPSPDVAARPIWPTDLLGRALLGAPRGARWAAPVFLAELPPVTKSGPGRYPRAAGAGCTVSIAVTV